MTCNRFFGGAIASGFILVVACSGSGGGASAQTTACDAYFDAIYTSNCGGTPPPASEQSRLKGRYEENCTGDLALPGIALTTSAVSACASSLETQGCGPFVLSEGACIYSPGALAAGAPCAINAQCKSGSCGGTSACGKCAAVVGTGASCANQPCSPGFACVTSGSVFTGQTQTCAAVQHVGAGATCDGAQTQCSGNFTCNLAMGKCVTPGGAGTACTSPADCAHGLACPGPNYPSRCASPGKAGVGCGGDTDCASGLGCDPTSSQCKAVTWAAAGKTCGGTTRCLVGLCQASGTCPKVIPDGGKCTAGDLTATCDTFSLCLGGTCRLGYAGVCP